jgi:methyl-accepting chemotaxis protein
MHPGKNNQPVEKNLLKDTALLLYNITSSTIRNKIITASLAIVAIPLLILSIATGKILSSGTEQLYLERMNAELRHIDNVISGILGKAMMDLDMLCSDDAIQKRGSLLLNKYYDTKEPTDMTKVKHYGDELVIYNLMKKMIKSHPDYVEIYLGTENGGFVTAGDYILRAGYDPRIRPWYKNGIAEPAKSKVADSYLSVTGEYVTAVVKAVSDSSGKIKAVAGIDISLKHLSDTIQGIRIGKTGYLILAQNDGTILAHPVKPELISKKAADTGIPSIEQFLLCRNGVTYYTFEGKRKMASFYNSPHTNWILIAVIEMSEVAESGSQIRNGIFITAIMILIFCMILYLYIMKRIISPVRELTDFGHSIAEGNLDTPLYMNRNDELGRLADDFNKMMRRLKESIDSIKGIIEMMPSIIIQLDTDGRIIEWNRQARKFAGISLDEAKGRLLSEIKPEISAYLKNFNENIESEKPVSFYRIKISGFDEKYFNLFIFLLKTENSGALF